MAETLWLKPYGCPECKPWRSRAFDGLPFLAWFDKAERWERAGREQRFCRGCGYWHWVKRQRC